MLKTTISRLKKVCAIAFVPRILRGELRYTPGKFEKFTYSVQRTAQKSTKCSNPKRSKSIKNKSPEDPQKYAVSTVCENSLKSEFADATLICNCKPKPVKDIARIANQIPDPLFKEKAACRCEKCNKDENIPCNTARKGTPPLYEPAPACHCNDCRRVIANIFGDSRLSKRPTNLPDLLSTIAHVHMKGDSGNSKLIIDSRIQPKAYNIPDNNKQPEPKKKEEFNEDKSLIKDLRTGPNSGTILMNQKRGEKSDSNWMYTNLYDVAPEENASIPSNKQKEQKFIWSDEYGNDYGQNSLHCEPNVAIDKETLKIYKTLMKKNANYESTEAGKVGENLMDGLRKMSEAKLVSDSITRASTPKSEEEKLRQKIEHLEETPMVEAEKSKIDGFNITPKVLTNEENAMNFTDSAFDEVAKRCLSSKHKQIDEIVLREMDKLGIPITRQKNERVKHYDLKKTENKKPASKQECSQGVFNLGDEAADQYLCEIQKTKDVNSIDNPMRTALLNSSLPPQHCEPRVSPTVKECKRTEFETEEVDPNTISTKKAWENQLDPKHVLTCNETCPISPKPLTDCCGNLEGTEAIYERNFIANQDNKHDKSVKEGTWDFIDFNKKATSVKEGSVKQDVILEQEEPCKHAKENSVFDDSLRQSVKSASAILTAATEQEKPSIKENPADEGSANMEEDRPSSDDKGSLEYENDEDDYKIDLGRLESASEQLHATSEQLLATSEQLLATSDQLQETSEQLRAATEILQASSGKVDPDNTNAVFIGEPSFEQLNKTTEKLLNSGEKFETLTENLESTSEKLQGLCDNFEQILLTQMSRSTDNKSKVTNAQRVIPSLLPSVTTGTFDSKTPTTPSTPSPTKQQENIDKSQTESENIEKDSQSSSKLASLAQQGATINPLKCMTSDLSSMLGPLPQVNDKTKLSELMKIVKERNKLIDTSNYLNASTIDGKKKNIPPLSMPMQNTPVNVITPGYPEVKRPLCKGVPNTKKPKVKFSTCDLKAFGIENNPPCYQETSIEYDIFENNVYQGVALTEDLEPASELKDEIAMRLKTLGQVLRSSYQQRKMETLEAVMLARTNHRRNRPRLFRSKNFDPWAPIPSWPQPKQNKKSKLQCPKDGCKSFPPTRAEHDPSCGLRPCDTFPTFPTRKFSTLDYFAILLADHDIIEIVENEDSPTLKRTFYRTEWTKPKYLNKPYTESRTNEEHLKVETHFEKPTIPRRISNTGNFRPKANVPILKKIPKNVPPQVLNLNLERLLLPTMASVSYAVVRHYTDGKDDEDIFWKPRSKIPTKAQLQNLKVDPNMNNQIGNSAKYLLLSYNSGGAKPEVKNSVGIIKKSITDPVKNVKSTEGETKTQKDLFVAA